MKLIGSLTSPYVRKVRIVLAEKKIEYKLELSDVWAPDTTISDFNPLGQVPCLVMDDGEALFDSRVICEYLDTLTPVGKLIPPPGRERAEVRCWEALGDGILGATVLSRVEHTQREPGERSQKWLARQRKKIVDGLSAVSKGLGENTWCYSKHLTLADISVACALGFLDFRLPDLKWRDTHPNLARYAARLAQRQSFIDTEPT